MITNAATAALGLSATDITGVLQAASLAPSLHNSQPWRFRVLPDQIELHADLERNLPVTDPEGRELRLSCGAALLNLRLTLQKHVGFQKSVSCAEQQFHAVRSYSLIRPPSTGDA